MSILCKVVGMGGFQTLLKSVSSDITVCVRGRHAVGKSEGVYQAASETYSDVYKDTAFCAQMVSALGGKVRAHVDGKIVWAGEWTYEMGMPVVERRLSQMTEGDIIGLPELHNITDGTSVWRSTAFRPCDWLIQSCQFPVMLFLDERNRALPGVKQAVFQLADSKAFYGHVLHEESRICVAENVGQNYQVEQSDPAEVSRWVTVELSPDEDDWLDWAEDKIHPALFEYIRVNKKNLEHTGAFEPEKKYPDRRSWYKLDGELQRLGLYEDENPNKTNLQNILCGAFLGPEIGNHFDRYLLQREREIKATDILENWKKARKRLSKGQTSITNEQYVEATAKLGDFLKEPKNILTKEQARQYAYFMADCPPEARMTAFAQLQKNSANLFTVHPFIEKLMVDTASGSDTSKFKVPELKDSDKEPKKAPAPRKRGRK